MKEIVSRFTFGFLMAQLVPGAVALAFITLVFTARDVGQGASLSRAVQLSAEGWLGAHCCVPDGVTASAGTAARPGLGVAKIAAFLVLAIAVGMLIHGVNWMVLAWLENHQGSLCTTRVRTSFWHRARLFVQLVLAPLKMVLEVLWILKAPGIVLLAMDENAPEITTKDREGMFVFIQDFYLYFFQFYSHTAYALLCGIPCLALAHRSLHHSVQQALPSLVGLYLLTSLFFLIGRVQYTSMCMAEFKFLCKSVTPVTPPRPEGLWEKLWWWLWQGPA